MEKFTRTDLGIANYAKFYNVDYLFITEGKTVSTLNSDERVPDCEYYFNLISTSINNKRIKIKAVGSKENALNYLEGIAKDGSNKTFLLIDRDYEGVHNSIIRQRLVIHTDGYSWENDFWNPAFCKALLTDLTGNSTKATNLFDKIYPRIVKRLHLLSSLDAAANIDKKAILRKNSSLCGINLDINKNYPIDKENISRFIKQFKQLVKTDTLISTAAKEFSKHDSMKLIQGHLWFGVMYSIIANIYMKFTADSRPSKKLILNLALNKFNSNPRSYHSSLVSYYQALI